MSYFGIDIGCTAIKYGEVTLAEEIETTSFDMMLIPKTKRTERYTNALIGLVDSTNKYQGLGIGFPSVVWDDGIMNLEIRFNDIWAAVQEFLNSKNVPHFAINDADAAGFAELYHPQAGALRKGVTIVLTLGTGVGSAIFLDGKLLPNTEFGMLDINGMMIEQYVAPSIKRKENLSMKEWSARLQEVIEKIETVLSPDHILLGGGISSDFEKYRQYLKTKRAVLGPAYYRNQAGVVGAAMYAAYRMDEYAIH
jgi:polyphosphate glucokinase